MWYKHACACASNCLSVSVCVCARDHAWLTGVLMKIVSHWVSVILAVYLLMCVYIYVHVSPRGFELTSKFNIRHHKYF